jgi:hypothetical protein
LKLKDPAGFENFAGKLQIGFASSGRLVSRKDCRLSLGDLVRIHTAANLAPCGRYEA